MFFSLHEKFHNIKTYGYLQNGKKKCHWKSRRYNLTVSAQHLLAHVSTILKAIDVYWRWLFCKFHIAYFAAYICYARKIRVHTRPFSHIYIYVCIYYVASTLLPNDILPSWKEKNKTDHMRLRIEYIKVQNIRMN